MKTIFRINKDQFGDVVATIQHVYKYELIKNSDISKFTDEGRRGFNDQIRSGDLERIDFNSDFAAHYVFNFHFKSLSMIINGDFSGYRLNDLKTQTTVFTRLNTSFEKSLQKDDLYINSIDNLTLLTKLFKSLKVIGGNVDLGVQKKLCFNDTKKETISAICELLN